MFLLQKHTNSLGFGSEDVPNPRNSYDFSVAHMGLGLLELRRFISTWGFSPGTSLPENLASSPLRGRRKPLRPYGMGGGQGRAAGC